MLRVKVGAIINNNTGTTSENCPDQTMMYVALLILVTGSILPPDSGLPPGFCHFLILSFSWIPKITVAMQHLILSTPAHVGQKPSYFSKILMTPLSTSCCFTKEASFRTSHELVGGGSFKTSHILEPLNTFPVSCQGNSSNTSSFTISYCSSQTSKSHLSKQTRRTRSCCLCQSTESQVIDECPHISKLPHLALYFKLLPNALKT